MVSLADGECIHSKRWETSVFGGGKEGDRKCTSRKRERRGEIRAVTKAGTERGCRTHNGHGRNSSFFSACPSPKPEGRAVRTKGRGTHLPCPPHPTSPLLSLQLFLHRSAIPSSSPPLHALLSLPLPIFSFCKCSAQKHRVLKGRLALALECVTHDCVVILGNEVSETFKSKACSVSEIPETRS